jgi:gamma-glutamylcyclotransferase (GGCT)/AIG2-like uncharacterized protein YtfP
MNSVDMANDLISRARNLQEFTVTTDVPENFRFNDVVPFDMEIKENIIHAKVYSVDFNEAVTRLDEWLETCK